MLSHAKRDYLTDFRDYLINVNILVLNESKASYKTDLVQNESKVSD